MDGREPTDRRRSVALNLRLLEPTPPQHDLRIEGVDAAKIDRLPKALDLPALVDLYAGCLVGHVVVEREQIGMVNASKEYANVRESTVELSWQVVT
jgi:hypothetical protein